VRFIRIVAIFLLIGPPAGGITVWLVALSVGLLRDAPDSSVLHGLPAFILFSYPLGGLFALACGIVHAVSAIWLRWSSIWVPLITGTVLSMPVWIRPHLDLPQLEGNIALSMTPMLAASLICWRVSRPLLRGA